MSQTYSTILPQQATEFITGSLLDLCYGAIVLSLI
jgi:hypothetical protein